MVAASAEVLAVVSAQGLQVHPEGPAIYLVACGMETRAQLTGPGINPQLNGPESFGPRLVKPKGTEFLLRAWGQPLG